jgi:hypothetical protein
MLLWDALVQAGCSEEVREYRGRLYMEHDLPRYEVHVDIMNDMDDAMEKATHVVLTALCSQRLPNTVDTPISLYPIQDHFDPEWKAHIDDACNIF